MATILVKINYHVIITSFFVSAITGNFFNQNNKQEIIIDSNYNLSQIFLGKEIPNNILENLRLISVEYYSFDGKIHRGQLVIHNDLASEISEIFEIIKAKKFPIAKVIPINHYDWSDDLSTADNNTSAFNYRYVKGTKKLSAHSFGKAIDINPQQNPHIKKGGSAQKKLKYNPLEPGTITSSSFLTKEFLKRGWSWGGNWKNSKDYQHFEKLK